LTWDEGADGLEIAQSGREKRVVAMMEWSREAGWMDGWEERFPDAGARLCVCVCMPPSLPSVFACFLHIALICLSCLLLLYRPSAAAVAGPGVLLTPSVSLLCR
jgi:hypothetical protein